MRYVRVKGHYAYQTIIPGPRNEAGNRVGPDRDRLEVIEPGSVVGMPDDLAESFVIRGMGVFCDGPEVLVRPGRDEPERPGVHPGPARAEQATGRAQRVGAV